MPPSAWSKVPGAAAASRSLPEQWRLPLRNLAIVWGALLALFHTDWLAMAGQWWNSSTYNHILLVPLIVGWLIQQRAEGLARLNPEGWRPGVAVFGMAALIWSLGAMAGLAIVSQFGAVAMLIAAVPTLLGPRVAAGMAFPLAYMLFLVPFGDALVPPMQMITAALTVGLVHVSGMAATIDGVFIQTPAALFEVAEACSGVKFLIAMIAFGVLAAHVCFRSWRRRGAFLMLCLAVPILANGVRAWGTIYLAQFVGAERATGVDHLIYGWVFFAVVIALTLAIAWRFFDRPRDDAMIDPEALAASPLLTRLANLRVGHPTALAGVLVLAVLGRGWVFAADSVSAQLRRQVFLPEVPGWHRVDYAPREWWEPRASGAQHRLLGSYADRNGRKVDVFLAVYATQRAGAKAAGTGEGALTPDSGWSWLAPGPAVADGTADRLLAIGRTERLAESWYHTGGLTTGSAARLSFATLMQRLTLRPAPTMMLIVSAEEQPDKPAAEAIAAFRQSTGSPGPWMDRIAAVR